MVSVYPVLHYEENYEELLAELQQYDYHFENLVFSGGAIKTTSFFGGIKVSVNYVTGFSVCSASGIANKLLI